MYSERLIEISNNSKLSINTVYKIDCIIKQVNKREFTAQELSLELGVTVRTANRILLKLEDAGYLTEIGKHIIESKGRPSRIMNFKKMSLRKLIQMTILVMLFILSFLLPILLLFELH